MTRILIALLALAACGCARFPSGGSAASTTRLIFTYTVQGQIRTGQEQGGAGLPYVYIVALRLSTEANPTTEGPLPIVTPSGNGFVAGNATHYILWNPLANPPYQIFEFDDPNLNNSTQIGVPITFRDVQVGDREIAFEIDLSQLIPEADVPTIQAIQVNFLTMNNTNTSGGGRIWDALGNSQIPSEVNRFFTFDPTFSTTYTDANQGGIEPTGDTADPDLDLDDWSIEVRRD